MQVFQLKNSAIQSNIPFACFGNKQNIERFIKESLLLPLRTKSDKCSTRQCTMSKGQREEEKNNNKNNIFVVKINAPTDMIIT